MSTVQISNTATRSEFRKEYLSFQLIRETVKFEQSSNSGYRLFRVISLFGFFDKLNFTWVKSKHIRI